MTDKYRALARLIASVEQSLSLRGVFARSEQDCVGVGKRTALTSNHYDRAFRTP